MPGIVGQGLTFNLPNYVGELFEATPRETPFLSAIGGLTGGRPANATLFTWSGYDLRDADHNRQRHEGADAPTAEHRVRYSNHNVVEVHHEAVDISYTKQAATGQFASLGSTNPAATSVAGANNVMDEMTWQQQRALEQVARDVELSFLVGDFNNPADNTDVRKTRGLLNAIATNAVDKAALVAAGAAIDAAGVAAGLGADGDVVIVRGDTTGAFVPERQYYVVGGGTGLATTAGGAPIAPGVAGTIDVYSTEIATKDMVDDLMQLCFDNGGLAIQDTATVMVNSDLKRALTKMYITDANYQEQTRNVGGVNLQTFETDFGVLNIMLNRHMPSGALAVVSLEECAPRFLPIPGKGHFFMEPLAKTGATDKAQLYGEIGLEYGNELKHAVITGMRRA